MLILILIVLNIPIFLLIGWVVFGSKEQVEESVDEAFFKFPTFPELPSGLWPLFQEEGEEPDYFSILRLVVVLIACATAVAAEYQALRWLFPGLAAG